MLRGLDDQYEGARSYYAILRHVSNAKAGRDVHSRV